MRELEWVIRGLQAAAEQNDVVVLATVLSVEGSVYRGVGARMLITSAGETVGAVSGGCLEADVIARAPALQLSGRAEVVRYDTRASDEGILGLGMGCQGIIDLLLEPLSGPELVDAIRMYGVIASRRDAVTVATLTRNLADNEPPGARVVCSESGEVLVGDPRLLDRGADLSHECVRPAIPVLICGGGADALPVARLAHSLGWHVTLVDHRPSFASALRFPDAHMIVCANVSAEAGVLTQRLTVDYRTMAVVMAHSAEHDAAYLHALLDAGARYIGVLGPHRRTMELLGARADDGVPSAVHSPVGLDLGAETPDEIALAIVAEIAAVYAGRAGGLLRERPGPIHPDRR